MGKGIQYLRELAVLEMMYDINLGDKHLSLLERHPGAGTCPEISEADEGSGAQVLRGNWDYLVWRRGGSEEALYNDLKGDCGEVRPVLFSQGISDRMRANSLRSY